MQTPSASASPSVPAILAEVGGAILAGLIMAAVFGYGLGLVLQGSGLGMGLLSLMVFAAAIGFGAGAGAGATLAGRLLGQRGNAWLAMAAGAVGSTVVILAMRLLRVGGLFEILAVAALVSLALAVVAYNSGRPGQRRGEPKAPSQEPPANLLDPDA